MVRLKELTASRRKAVSKAIRPRDAFDAIDRLLFLLNEPAVGHGSPEMTRPYWCTSSLPEVYPKHATACSIADSHSKRIKIFAQHQHRSKMRRRY